MMLALTVIHVAKGLDRMSISMRTLLNRIRLELELKPDQLNL
jgi:hypothetical protein